MDIVTQPIADYLLRVTPARDPVLQKMEALARREGFPIVGPLVGRLLYQLALLIGARRILEMGSGYGYSAVWFARAMRFETRHPTCRCGKPVCFFARREVLLSQRCREGNDQSD